MSRAMEDAGERLSKEQTALMNELGVPQVIQALARDRVLSNTPPNAMLAMLEATLSVGIVSTFFNCDGRADGPKLLEEDRSLAPALTEAREKLEAFLHALKRANPHFFPGAKP